MEFKAFTGDLPHIPDDLTIGQFILDEEHELRPTRSQNTPWTVVDETGETRGQEEVWYGSG